MTPEVEAAVAELRVVFPGHAVSVAPEGQGGAYVVVHDLSLGDQYSPSTNWVGFLIDYQYPRSDVYPHFIDGAIVRIDGGQMGEGFGQTTWPGHLGMVWQVSRRSNRWDATLDTAALKLEKVLTWLRSR